MSLESERFGLENNYLVSGSDVYDGRLNFCRVGEKGKYTYIDLIGGHVKQIERVI